MSYAIALDVFQEARQRIAAYVRHTPLLPPPLLHPDVPPSLLLKLENMQVSGSFKARGIFNNLLSLDAAQRRRGVLAASGGNHGLALAYAAQVLAIPATVYLPANATQDREDRVVAWGAHVIRHGDSWDDAHAQAVAHAEAEGLAYIHPFNALRTLAGQGTLGLELLADAPDLDCVLVAVGGGGLLGGVAAAIKQQRPAVRIIGVEPTGAPSMHASRAAGQLVTLPHTTTIADTLSPRRVGEYTFALAQRYVDELVLVEDTAMIAAMRWLWHECNQLVEPAGAAVLAALRTGAADVSAARQPVAVICGGNAAVGNVLARYTELAGGMA